MTQPTHPDNFHEPALSASSAQSVNKEAGNVTFSRADLAQFLIDQAKAKFPDKIRFHFNQEVAEVELAGKQVGGHQPLGLGEGSSSSSRKSWMWTWQANR